MLTLTISLPFGGWLAIAFALILSGKLLQFGGVLYAEGRQWEWATLAGTLIVLGLIMPAAILIADQNFNLSR